jgi:hypothetical protein
MWRHECMWSMDILMISNYHNYIIIALYQDSHYVKMCEYSVCSGIV